ncbi:hypothetical protein Q7P37_009825 [Cladosporium fusiforme]
MINTDVITIHLKAFATASNPVSTGPNITHKDFQQDAAALGNDDTTSQASGNTRIARDTGDDGSQKRDYIAHLRILERQTEKYGEKLRRRSL